MFYMRKKYLPSNLAKLDLNSVYIYLSYDM